MKILLIDNYDSFTYNLYDYVKQYGVECEVVKNDVLDFDIVGSFDGIILSPGPKTPNDAGDMMKIIAQFYKTKPILGVCLGHQAIGLTFGAKLSKAIRPMHGHTSDIRMIPHWLFEGIPNKIAVMRYHSLVLENISAPLKVLALTEEQGEVMAIAHENEMIVGVQFHPESVLTKWGKKIIDNWLNAVEKGIKNIS